MAFAVAGATDWTLFEEEVLIVNYLYTFSLENIESWRALARTLTHFQGASYRDYHEHNCRPMKRKVDNLQQTRRLPPVGAVQRPGDYDDEVLHWFLTHLEEEDPEKLYLGCLKEVTIMTICPIDPPACNSLRYWLVGSSFAWSNGTTYYCHWLYAMFTPGSDKRLTDEEIATKLRTRPGVFEEEKILINRNSVRVAIYKLITIPELCQRIHPNGEQGRRWLMREDGGIPPIFDAIGEIPAGVDGDELQTIIALIGTMYPKT
ncbi:hypothetical protein MMC14_009735 [Varicellaria rhodocarpa]|nr:hypothetical protein [Varicellaria rhodocarpa]